MEMEKSEKFYDEEPNILEGEKNGTKQSLVSESIQKKGMANKKTPITSGKFGKRFSLPNYDHLKGSVCPTTMNHLFDKKTVYKLELRWSNKVYLSTSFMDKYV
jgi:hypothetical protein